jgi:hypothetical protein
MTLIQPNTALDHAAYYARRGWRVAPIAPGTKWPRLDAWQEVATTNLGQIGEWWMARPNDGVSIVCGVQSGIFVIDVDPYHDGDQTLAELEALYEPLPDTVESITGRNGRHLYFKMPADHVITNDASNLLGQGLDVRGDGGQVVAPPTVHPQTGQPYAWEAMHDPFDGIVVADAPEWLIEILTRPQPQQAARREKLTRPPGSTLPGDHFAATVTWPEMLEADGWQLHSVRSYGGSDYELWTRPGKDTRDGASASLYYQGSDVLKVFSSSCASLGLESGATYTRFGYMAARHHGGDMAAAARSIRRTMDPDPPMSALISSPGGTARPSESVDGPSLNGEGPSRPSRPSIVCNGRQLDDVTNEATVALQEANTPPTVFVRSGAPVRIREDEHSRPLIEQLMERSMRHRLAAVAWWFRVNKDGDRSSTSPPLDIVGNILAAGSWPFPVLSGVTEVPVLRMDGSVYADHGHDPSTGLYHWHKGDSYPPMPEAPTADELAQAVATIDDMLCDFPFDTTADRANAWALLLTAIVRPIVDCPVPMALIDAPEPGTGKGLLANIIAIITTGRTASMMAWPSDDEELEKRITATLISGATMIIFDNVEGTIRSPSLAAALTTTSWQGRILGRSENITVPNRATWLATGNNIDVGGDLARRCYRIRLDARQARPYERTGFRHDDLERWVTEQRVNILQALIVIIRSWWNTGRPLAASLPAMGGYTPWVRTVGGILNHAGVDGFLANLAEFHASSDRDANAWEAFLTSWMEEIGEASVTVSDLINRMKDIYTGNRLKEVLPEDLADHFDSGGFSKRLGLALRRRTGRHYGDAGLHIVEMPRDRRKLAIYAVSGRSVTPEARELADSETTPAVDNSLTRTNVNGAGVAGVTPPDREMKTYPQDAVGAPELPATPGETLPHLPHSRGLFEDNSPPF